MCSPRSASWTSPSGRTRSAELFGQARRDLDDELVGRLVERTDGWAAGLGWPHWNCGPQTDVAAFVTAFSGDDHAVAAYLLTEVIDGLDPALLDFLVRVSILDLVSADLADALTGEQRARPRWPTSPHRTCSCTPSVTTGGGTGYIA